MNTLELLALHQEGLTSAPLFLIKFRILYYRAATLLRQWSTIEFFLKKSLFFKHFFSHYFFKTASSASFRYIFQKESLVSSLCSKVAV